MPKVMIPKHKHIFLSLDCHFLDIQLRFESTVPTLFKIVISPRNLLSFNLKLHATVEPKEP